MLRKIWTWLEAMNAHMRGPERDADHDHEPPPRPVTPQRLSDDDYAAYLTTLSIRAEVMDHEFRCGQCDRMQHAGVRMVWVPDSVRRGDPLWSVMATCRRQAWNGHFTAWCLRCTRSFSPMTADEMLKYGSTPHDPIPTLPLIIVNRR